MLKISEGASTRFQSSTEVMSRSVFEPMCLEAANLRRRDWKVPFQIHAHEKSS